MVVVRRRKEFDLLMAPTMLPRQDAIIHGRLFEMAVRKGQVRGNKKLDGGAEPPPQLPPSGEFALVI